MSTSDDARERELEEIEELDAEVVEDLDVDEDAEDVGGGNSLGCRFH